MEISIKITNNIKYYCSNKDLLHIAQFIRIVFNNQYTITVECPPSNLRLIRKLFWGYI